MFLKNVKKKQSFYQMNMKAVAKTLKFGNELTRQSLNIKQAKTARKTKHSS